MLHQLLFLRPSIEGVSLTTENLAFKSLYALTTPLFLAFGVVFYTRLCFTDPINCITNSSESFKVLKAMDSYCLENSYILDPEGITQTLHNYQYFGLFFALCAALTYSTYVAWEWFENGTLKALLQDLPSLTLTVADKDSSSKLQTQIRTLTLILKGDPILLANYSFVSLVCEIFNPLILWGILEMGEEFLGGHSWPTSLHGEVNALTFPKVAHCSWDTGVVHYTGVCTMNLNYLSEKLFFFARYWLTGCLTLSIANGVYRYTLFKVEGFWGWVLTLGDRDDLIVKYVPLLIQRGTSSHHFFMLRRIQANVPRTTFARILEDFLQEEETPTNPPTPTPLGDSWERVKED